jgi:hypothetical protein
MLLKRLHFTHLRLDQLLIRRLWVVGVGEALTTNALLVSDPPFEETDIAERRKYFNVKDHREAMKFSPENVYNLEVIHLSFFGINVLIFIGLYDMDVDFCSIYGLQQV